ncbi:MAG: ammonium transporter, partial [Pseudomonadota bacterium]
TALMFIIHAGFLGYEMGASRIKNVLASGMKNILAFAFVIPTFFFFGWWIYLASPTGFPDFTAETGGAPWDQAMGPNLQDNATGIFWAAFTLFAATTASIFSGAVIERIKLSGFIILAILLGSVVWILGASWAWHGDGWLLTEWGWHDFGAAGCVHMIAAFFALGVLINLGPRIGKFNPDGTANELKPHNIPMAVFGLMVLIVGFFGFLGGCIIYNGTAQWTTIFGNPATLSAVAFNTLMCFSGGIIGGWITTRDPFWMMSGALAGIFAAASGLDVYWPPLAFLLGMAGGVIAPIGAKWLENTFKIDDAVGAVSVHGFAGAFGVIAFGIFGAGYPNGDYPDTNLMGQIVGAVSMGLLGFIPGYVVSLLLKGLGLLRIPEEVEIMGMDRAEIPVCAYPEGMQASRGMTASTPAE